MKSWLCLGRPSIVLILRNAELAKKQEFLKTSMAATRQIPAMADGVLVPFPERYGDVVVIGAGGMGKIYKALDRTLGRTVAIKTLLVSELMDNPDFKERFFREAKILAALDHPNIIRVFDLQEEPSPYISLEYIEGQTLRQLIVEGGSKNIEAMGALALQLLGALHYIGEKGILHRDLKPENILVTLGGQLKLADFGLGQSESMTNLTRTGLVVGTPLYLSPERLKGGDTDLKSEIYCASVVLYEMFCAQRPYPTDNVIEIILGRHIPLRERNPAVPESLAGVIESGMSFDRDKRPATFEELSQKLRQVFKLP